MQLMRTDQPTERECPTIQTDRNGTRDPTQCSFENLQRKTGRGLSPGMNEGNVDDGGATRYPMSAGALRGGEI